MRAYLGATRSRTLMARLDREGIGEMWTAGQDRWPPRRPFALDCGTFSPWRNGRTWSEEPFLWALDMCRRDGVEPDWIVCPDLIARGVESLRFSLGWRDRLAGFRVLLAVQDGMAARQVGRVLHRFDGLFVGGTLAWKIRTAAGWVKLAHRHGKPCHIGRVGNPRRVRWAKRIGADSIDSSQPLWAKEYTNRWLAALGDHPQTEIRCA